MTTGREPGKGKPLGGNDLESMLESFRTRRKGREPQKSASPASRSQQPNVSQPSRVTEKQSPHYDYAGEKKMRVPDPVPEPEPEIPRISVRTEIFQKQKELEERQKEENEKLGLKGKLEDNLSDRHVIADAAARVSTLDAYVGSTKKSQQKKRKDKRTYNASHSQKTTARSLLKSAAGIRSAIVLSEIIGKPRAMREY
ncbi:MAG: hypothetical protein ABIH86_04660 [Planctomycetota bacterium]